MRRGIKEGIYGLAKKLPSCLKKKFEISLFMLLLLYLQTYIVSHCLWDPKVLLIDKLSLLAYHFTVFILNVYGYSLLVESPEEKVASSRAEAERK